jgi:DNA primase
MTIAAGDREVHDLVRYYKSIADRMLPRLQDRPVLLVRARTIPEQFMEKSGGTNWVGKIPHGLPEQRARADHGGCFACARPGLGVSMPIAWDEFMSLKGGAQWKIATAREYLSFQASDPWGGYWKKKQTLTRAIKTSRSSRKGGALRDSVY